MAFPVSLTTPIRTGRLNRPRWLIGAATTRGSRSWWLAGCFLALLFTTPAWLPWTGPHLNLLWEQAKGVDDAKNHMLRTFLMGWLIGHGVWYPRWVPDLFMGYGYPIFNYYAPGFYYLALLLRTLLRLDTWDAYRAGGVVAALLAASGSYALVTSVWRRASLGILAALTVLYGPYVVQTNLFQRGDIPELLGLSVLPWLLFAIWRLWRAESRLAIAGWMTAFVAAGAAELLVHNLTALTAAVVAAAWALYLLVATRSWSRLGLVTTAGSIALALTAFFWVPATFEARYIQLEIGEEGHLDYRQWLLDPAGHTPKQQSPENRQTRAGLIDLHLHYPHQHEFIVTLKASLAQAGLALLALFSLAAAALGARHWLRAPAGAGASPGARSLAAPPLGAIAPLLCVAVACWLLTFTFAEPVWQHLPGLPLLQYPGRLLGPLGLCIAVAGAGALALPLALLEQRGGWWGRTAGWGLVAVVAGGVLFNCLGAREVPYLEHPKEPMDGRMVVFEEGDRFGLGTTSGGEFTPRDVQIAVYTAGQRRGKPLFERLYPEADWLGGLFTPLDGDLRFLGWRGSPLAINVRVANDSAQPGLLGLRQFRFPGWRAWVDGHPEPVQTAPYIPEQQASLGFIAVAVPPGEHMLSLAFGPTRLRFGAIVLSTLTAVAGTGALVYVLGRARRARPLVAGIAWAIVAVAVTYCGWRGVRPAFGAFGPVPAAPARASSGVWQAPDLQRGGAGLLVNVAEAVRTGQAAISSPSGATTGPDKFVDVRQLTVSDANDPERGAAGTSRREWLYLHPPSSVSVDVALPAGRETWFQASLSLDPAVWQAASGDGVRYQVTVTRLDGTQPADPTAVLDTTFNPRATLAQRRWMPVEADLSPWAGHTVRLVLRTEPREDLTFDWAGWANPLVVVRQTARVRPPKQ